MTLAVDATIAKRTASGGSERANYLASRASHFVLGEQLVRGTVGPVGSRVPPAHAPTPRIAVWVVLGSLVAAATYLVGLVHDPSAPLPPALVTEPPPAPVTANEESEVSDIVKTGEYRWQITRARWNSEIYDDPDVLGRQARVRPYYRDGRPTGFEVLAVRPHRIFNILGFRAGDIVLSANGEALRSPNKAIAAHRKLKDARTVSVEIERDGHPLTLVYEIIGAAPAPVPAVATP